MTPATHRISTAARRRDAFRPAPGANGVDPAMLTWPQYRDVVDRSRKSHPDDAYATTLADLKAGYLDRSDFDVLIQRLSSRGLRFELRAKEERIAYCKRTDDDLDYLRDEAGQLIPYADEEIAERGWKPVEHTVAVFDEKGVCVAALQDEWGCVLVRVAEEYRGFGFGMALTKLAMTLDPTKPSGGFTRQGLDVYVRAHRELVREALADGRYRAAIAAGEITVDAVREIVDSARLDLRPKRRPDVATHDPSNWAIYASEHGAFVVYDKRLRDFVESDGAVDDHWIENAIKGYLLVRIPNQDGLVVRLGADMPGVKRFLLSCASAYCEKEGFPLAVDPEDLPFIDPERMEITAPADRRSGFMRTTTRAKGEVLDLDGIGFVERAWRKSFDRYDEFHDRMLEIAESKYMTTAEKNASSSFR